MCGIVGYVGNKRPENVLISGLKALEYRGYDSAGIALKNNNDLQIIKSVGKIKKLEEKIKNTDLISANLGIAHTRWATHGMANEVNAHPHIVGDVTLVHNGIIENAILIKEKLIKKGVNFKSDTDTEVAAALINYYYDGDEVKAIEKAVKIIKGSYAFGIMFSSSDKLYAIRKGSPLIIGLSCDGNFIASDIMAIINYTNKYILLDEEEIAIIDSENINIVKDGKEKKYDILKANVTTDDRDKCGYSHYMLKEIMEEPILLEKSLKSFFKNTNQLVDLNEYDEIHIVACGSAMYAGMIGKSLLEEKTNLHILCEVASEYRYKNIIYDRNTLVILVSQSGETADTIAAMRMAKKSGVDTLSIVNVKTSTIARESDKQIFIEAGPEIAVATTKAYILQVFVFSLLAYKASGFLDKLEIEMLPRYVKEVLDKRDVYLEVAKKIYKRNDIFFYRKKNRLCNFIRRKFKIKGSVLYS